VEIGTWKIVVAGDVVADVNAQLEKGVSCLDCWNIQKRRLHW
jgi:hypothetical protein